MFLIVEMTFEEVAIGQTFFDPESGEEFIKLDEQEAGYISGGDAFEGQPAPFYSDDIVEVDIEIVEFDD